MNSLSFSAHKIETYVLRPLFIFTTFVLMLLAIFQATGRMALYAVHLFEPQINAVLGLRDIRAQDIVGDWRGLNPVLRIGRLEFPQGHATQIEFELDLAESAWRNHLVARHGSVAEVVLHAEQDEEGWRLRGAADEPLDFDVWPLVNYSDGLSAMLRLVLHGQDLEEQVAVELLAANAEGAHFGRATLRSGPSGNQVFTMQVWRRDAMFATQSQSNVVQVTGELMVPSLLSGMPSATLSARDAGWHDLNGIGGGRLALRLEDLLLPGTDVPLYAELALHLQRRELQVQGRTELLAIGDAEQRLELPPAFLTGRLVDDDPGEIDAVAELLGAQPAEPVLQVWLEHLDLSDISEFSAKNLGGWGAAGRWLGALNVQGVANNLHFFFDPEHGLGYSASVADVHMKGYKGAPTLRGAEGRVWGFERGVAARLNSSDTFVQFPELYNQGWQLAGTGGILKAWFGNGYFGLVGSHLRFSIGTTNLAGSFAVTRPGPRFEQRVSLDISTDQLDIALSKTFVPKKMPRALRRWLEQGPRRGTISDARFAYHGQVHLRPGERARRLELLADLGGGRVQFDPRWPLVSDIEGRLHVAGRDTRVDVISAQTRAIRLGRSRVVVHDNGAYVHANVAVDTNALAGLDYIRKSPLIEDMPFVTPEWAGSGELNLRGELIIPINAEQAPPLAVDLSFDVDTLALDMPNYRLSFAELAGSGSFSLPHFLGGRFSGRMFDAPATIDAAFDEQWLRFKIEGSATPEDIYRLIEFDSTVPAQGQFEFTGTMSLAMGGGVSILSVTSDLQGLVLALPASYAKTAEEIASSELDVQFLDNYQSVSWRYKDVQGWLHFSDEIERGALGVNSLPPMTAQADKAILVSGSMSEVVLSEWVSAGGESAVSLPLDWVIQDLLIDRFVIDELSFANVSLDGWQRGEDARFEFDAPDIQGVVGLPGLGMMSLDLSYLRLPVSDAEVALEIDPLQAALQEPDPLSVAVGESLPAAKVNVDQLDLGDDPFGAWRFTIHPEADVVWFRDFSADVNGVHIEQGDVSWHLADDESTFEGAIRLDDLAETLPKWDYAASLTTDNARLIADVAWSGSPANVSLLGMRGEMEFRAKDGRFMEVESGGGGLRILSLMNFSKIANRISLDFSDVVGQGLSFEKIEATVGLDEGQLVFPKRMRVDSSSGNFQVGGFVDLHSGMLDNEMIVTLPVSKSLPWYAVYLSLANPLAGLGVVVGERVLRKPLEQFSSAKFEVKGTLDEPEVNFVSLWDTSLKQTQDKKTQEIN